MSCKTIIRSPTFSLMEKTLLLSVIEEAEHILDLNFRKEAYYEMDSAKQKMIDTLHGKIAVVTKILAQAKSTDIKNNRSDIYDLILEEHSITVPKIVEITQLSSDTVKGCIEYLLYAGVIQDVTSSSSGIERVWTVKERTN